MIRYLLFKHFKLHLNKIFHIVSAFKLHSVVIDLREHKDVVVCIIHASKIQRKEKHPFCTILRYNAPGKGFKATVSINNAIW